MPVFDGLLEEPYNLEILSLLYTMVEWHALAKLRLHTSNSLVLLREATAHLGQLLQKFRLSTCSQFSTKELPSEAAKRIRQAARKKSKPSSTETNSQPQKPSTNNTKTTRTLNLSTYKLHALGDYVSTIQWFGTTDSYTTQTVSYISNNSLLLLKVKSG